MRGRFMLITPNKEDREAIKAQLDGWYRQKAEEIFAELLTESMKRAAIMGIYGTDATQLRVEIAIQLERIIETHKIRDWTHNIDVQRRITNDIEDYLFDIQDKHNLHISDSELDMLLEQLIHTAKQRDGS